MTNETIYYTYTYFDPSKNMEPIYVGKGTARRSIIHVRRKKATTPIVIRVQEMKKDGIEPIITKIEGLTEDEAFAKEIELISLYGRIDLGTGTLLNKTNGGQFIGALGRKLSEEHKKKISERKKGTICTPEHRAKLSEAGKGRITSDEARANLSKALKGKPFTPEHTAAIKKYQQNMTEEHRRNISLGQIGKKVSDEARANLSKALKGRVFTPEHRAKIAATKAANKLKRLQEKENVV